MINSINTWLWCFRSRVFQPAYGSWRILLSRQHRFHCWRRGSVADALRLLILLPLIWVEGAWALDCPDDNYVLNTQAEVDALGATGCDRIWGRLHIGSSTDITNLDGLANLTYVGDSLLIRNNAALTNIDGLANLTLPEFGDLEISYNAALTNIDGLANLTFVGESLYIRNNAALTNIDGLANLTSVGASWGGNLEITNNAALTNVDGLANLISVGYTEGSMGMSYPGNVEIRGNAALTNLDGLTTIRAIHGALHIADNDVLPNVDGLANLFWVGGLKIRGNAALTSLSGLANLIYVDFDLSIFDNDALTNLDGLANVVRLKWGYLEIANNDALTNIDGLAGLTGADGVYIYDNATLPNVDGLASLVGVGRDLFIGNNASLRNLDGLANLTSVWHYLDGNLYILANEALTNLDGLANLTIISGNLSIDRNYSATCEGIAPVLGWPNGPPGDTVGGDISIGDNGAGCDSVEEILASVSGPTQPVINQATTSNTSISLGFTPSTTTDTLFPITSYEAICAAAAELSEAPVSVLRDNVPVSRTLNASGSFISSVEIDINITHDRPEHLYVTLTTPQGTELILWDRAGAGTFDINGTFPTTLTPNDALSGIDGQSMEGDWVLYVEDVVVGPLVKEGVLNSWGIRITEELTGNGSGSPIEVLGATLGRDYACTVSPVTQLGTTPASDSYTVSVPNLPAAPSIISTDYGDGEVVLKVSVTDNGGTAITGYEATCTDGNNTYTGTSTSSPITVTGLTNGVAYTCKVTAISSAGRSPPSAATEPIIPEELQVGLPIWLLYLATQQANNVPVDTDNDGVEDRYDFCANTPQGASVDASGCSDSQI